MTKLTCDYRRSTSSRPLFSITLTFLELYAAQVDLSLPSLLTAPVYTVLKPGRSVMGPLPETSQLFISQQLKGCAKHFIGKGKPRFEWVFPLGFIV